MCSYCGVFVVCLAVKISVFEKSENCERYIWGLVWDLSAVIYRILRRDGQDRSPTDTARNCVHRKPEAGGGERQAS